MTVKIVTDSTADLSKEMAEGLGITVVPLNVNFGTQVYRDGVDIEAGEFYQRLVVSNPLPTTSQPSAGAFLEWYQGLLAEEEPIVSIHLSSKLSGTMNSALQAKEQAGAEVPIEVVDSETVSMGLGLVVMAASEMAATGASLEEVLKATHQAMARMSVLFMVDTLEYLQKGGRIGRAQAFLGSVLGVRPVLEVREGEVLPLERVRTRSRAIDRLYTLVEELAPLPSLVVGYTTTPEEAEVLAQRASPLVEGGEVPVIQIGPVLGTHVGPGTLGVGLRRRE